MLSLVPERNIETEINRLITTYGNSILRMCFIYLKDIHLAEDALQDTYIKVYKNYSSFKGNSSEKTWIMRIAINVCKNYLRSSWWKRKNEEVSLESITATENMEENDDLVLEIMKLSYKYKEVILLYYYQELKIREIAKVLNIPESTVSIRLKRAREKLKISLEDNRYNE
ncbi:sigma-70 family RNA polymerase sigma factor [Clostridium sp. 'deep sea']|uniref:sigma-70 family RNA polymerase sigma factor n=1 Tax=Clostridium sp. 'deep sea' TaxID=2779445 RepID=UPI0018965F51|nr:sigma-70 family RNA polymerase sigma factor [Clostridium sp. 'deep sea']QOR34877.1 sigma-70 family RNA polymerase sigma factor [Clostridium sp. 'deep sea']